jgi:hypothetical protein
MHTALLSFDPFCDHVFNVVEGLEIGRRFIGFMASIFGRLGRS